MKRNSVWCLHGTMKGVSSVFASLAMSLGITSLIKYQTDFFINPQRRNMEDLETPSLHYCRSRSI